MFRKFKKFINKLKNSAQLKFSKNNIESTHMKVLQFLHKKRTPRTYLEIGVQEGRSIILADKKTKTIGIDPINVLCYWLNKNIKMYFMTSDNFFEKINPKEVFGGEAIDLAFIDGMHLFEFALRDFINVEKNCHNDSTIILHDTIPLNKETSSREILKGSWTGDVFKMVLILKKYRPDLKLYNLEKSPGACIIKNLNPNSSVLKENYDKIIAEYMNLTFDDIATDLNEQLSVLSFDKFEDIKKIL